MLTFCDVGVAASYVKLINAVCKVFHDTNSYNDFVTRIGTNHLEDITELPEFKAMNESVPLPPGFTLRDYRFYDATLGNGVMDVTFYEDGLANMRAQFFWLVRQEEGKQISVEFLSSFL